MRARVQQTASDRPTSVHKSGNTGGRVSEITGLKVADVVLDACAAVRIRGKGRKERSVPLWRTTVTEIRRWLARTQAGRDQPLFPGWSGTRMSRPAVTARLQLAVQNAVKVCPQLAQREVSPHVIRHYLPFLTMSCPAAAPAFDRHSHEALPT